MKNYEGTSNGMQCGGAVRLWNQTQALGLRYTVLVGDGDCNIPNAICNLNGSSGPYSVPVMQEECLNHVSKRLGTRLHTLKKNMRISQPTKMGKNIGWPILVSQLTLTDKNIDDLVKYYASNIYSVGPNATVHEARMAILVTFYHGKSNDTQPRHQDCPAGKDSWC